MDTLPGRIVRLPREVAERIAAGEVVERPASVVKELVENSLDAGARTVSVVVEGAGLRRIRVSDDGIGMTPGDAPLAVERFATSKILRAEDLEQVATYGFRGEALPSIAAVSRFDLVTRPPAQSAATRVRVIGGGPAEVRVAAGAPGTTVTVEDLFFNTPARRKFLKSPGREFALIVDAVQRLALAAPRVAFRLSHDGREVLAYPPATPDERLAQVLGRSTAAQLVPVAGPWGTVAVAGWVTRPEAARPGRGLDYLFVNGRPIQSRLLWRAVVQGCAELLPHGHHPIAVLFLTVPPGALDVNIHPRKLEVRLADEHRAFAAVVHAVRGALLGPGGIREVGEGGGPGHASEALAPASSRAASLAPASSDLATLAPASSGPATLLPGRASSLPDAIGETGGAYAQGAAAVPAAQVTFDERGRLPPLRLLGQVHATYLLAEDARGVVLVDQHAAHERVLYERLLEGARRGRGATQLLAVPVTVDLSPREEGVLAEFLAAAPALGFDVEEFGRGTLLVRGVPAALAGRPVEPLVRAALEALADPGGGDEALRRLAIATACHTAVRSGDVLTPEAATALLRDLAATEDPYTCFHGRPTMVRVALETVDRWFLRR
ncbi:MAG: DNA mismatch repair endonuclease MutL [Armatimonadota bacterium]|nr:DNA mismatch repair endonuclease MutL [Armatimonadota bacterium]MDR7448354.1 DNA mismatch repair endonuclease MutL [Armatimonadota bacterium]MDR7459755.1 DNA mismatch repair endonuclease MutL [Armatimonadota bacterium]MDR7479282.1 DNA mismatch repair endonuclease MutL [Armatimonadota bacterium]MDR7489059.1 DNA mismatch repair endonuclease MutL [Armatimonadota bacterium]